MPENIRTISFHPKLAAVMDALINLVLLYGLQTVNTWWVFCLWMVVRLALWAMLIRLVYYPQGISRLRHFAALAFFSLSIIIGLMIFADWVWSWRLLSVVFI